MGKQIKLSHLIISAVLFTALYPINAKELNNNLDAEYTRLLNMVKNKRKPVGSIDGIINIINQPGIGMKDSDVILIEFGDFQCPFCKRHLMGTAQQIYEKMVLTNKIRYIFMDFPLDGKHPLAAKVAVAARCAEEQGKYWKMRNTLYKNQKAHHEVFLESHAKTSGLDVASFNKCLQSGRYNDAIKQDIIVGRNLGVKSTPMFYIGIKDKDNDQIKILRLIRGAQPYNVFEKEIFNVIKMTKIK